LTHDYAYATSIESPLALKIKTSSPLSTEAQLVKNARRFVTDAEFYGLVVPLQVAQKYPDVWGRHYHDIPRYSNYKIAIDYTPEHDHPRGHIIEHLDLFKQSQSTMSTHLTLERVRPGAKIVIDPDWL
jgi:hypothetical protein